MISQPVSHYHNHQWSTHSSTRAHTQIRGLLSLLIKNQASWYEYSRRPPQGLTREIFTRLIKKWMLLSEKRRNVWLREAGTLGGRARDGGNSGCAEMRAGSIRRFYDSFLQKCQLPNGDAAQTDTTLHVLNIREIVSSTKVEAKPAPEHKRSAPKVAIVTVQRPISRRHYLATRCAPGCMHMRMGMPMCMCIRGSGSGSG